MNDKDPSKVVYAHRLACACMTAGASSLTFYVRCDPAYHGDVQAVCGVCRVREGPVLHARSGGNRTDYTVPSPHRYRTQAHPRASLTSDVCECLVPYPECYLNAEATRRVALPSDFNADAHVALRNRLPLNATTLLEEAQDRTTGNQEGV